MNEIQATLDKEHSWKLELTKDKGWIAMWQFRNSGPAMAKRSKVRKALDAIGCLTLSSIITCDYGFRFEIAAGV